MDRETVDAVDEDPEDGEVGDPLPVPVRGGAQRRHPQREVATAVTTVHLARRGVWCVRVHDVVATVDALDVAAAIDGVTP